MPSPSADLDTALIERERSALFDAPGLPLELAAAGVAAHALGSEAALRGRRPWSRRDGWRIHGGARRRFDLLVGGTHHTATLERGHDGALRLGIGPGAAGSGSSRWDFSARALGGGRHDVQLGDRRAGADGACASASGWRSSAASGMVELQDHDPIAHAADGAAEGGRLTAPMPGKVIALLAKAGDAVTAGQALAVMEAMKMEHTLNAPRDGIVAELLYAVGDQVAEGAELLKLE